MRWYNNKHFSNWFLQVLWALHHMLKVLHRKVLVEWTRKANHFERPWDEHSMMFLRVYLICVSLDLLLYMAKPSTTIDHSVPVEKGPWAWQHCIVHHQKKLTMNMNMQNRLLHHLIGIKLWLGAEPWFACSLSNIGAQCRLMVHSAFLYEVVHNIGLTNPGRQDATKRIISPALWSIKITLSWLSDKTMYWHNIR